MGNLKNTSGGDTMSFTRSGDLNPRRFVVMADDEGETIAQATAGAATIGVVESWRDGYPASAPVPVRVAGACIVEAGAAFVAGTRIASDATGRAVTATAGDSVAGLAMSRATAEGEWATVLLSAPTAGGPGVV